MDGRWHPGIGDPTIGGWLTVAAYALASTLCFFAARNRAESRWSRTIEAQQERKIWLYLTLALALLCVNKQLDLQLLFNQTFKDMAIRDGWYEQRGGVQKLVIVGLSVAGILLATFGMIVATKFRNRWIRYALLGFVGLIMFVLIRAASFHHVDRLIGMTFSGMRMNWILEIPPILLIAISAFRTIRNKRAVRGLSIAEKR